MFPVESEFSAMKTDPQNLNPWCAGQLWIPFQLQVGPKAGPGKDPKGRIVEEEELELGFESGYD